jgi:hypothetical protein
MSFGAISDIYWAHHRQVFCGSYCNAQGVVQTMGETAAALSTLSVAIYSWLAVHQNPVPTYRPWRCLAVVVLIWLWVLLWAVIPLGIKKDEGPDAAGNVQNFYTPTPWCKSSLLGALCDTFQRYVANLNVPLLGCWINGKYMTERVIAEYLWYAMVSRKAPSVVS